MGYKTTKMRINEELATEGKQRAYECPNGHINTSHKSKPNGWKFVPACSDCGRRVERIVIER